MPPPQKTLSRHQSKLGFKEVSSSWRGFEIQIKLLGEKGATQSSWGYRNHIVDFKAQTYRLIGEIVGSVFLAVAPVSILRRAHLIKTPGTSAPDSADTVPGLRPAPLG